MSELETRVLNAIPAGAFEMNALLTLLRIEETDSVPSASVSCERRPVLRINPAFVARHCRSDEHLFLLVMHELHHVLLGHTRLFRRASRAHNLAFDALINAMLVARFPADAYRSFFLDLYGEEDGPLRLLAPPDGNRISDHALARLHHILYSASSVTAEEVFNAIVATVKDCGDTAWDAAVLLGDHAGPDEDAWGTDGPLDPEFVEAIRTIVEKWPPPEMPVRGRSLSDALEQATVNPARPAADVLRTLRRALMGAALKRFGGGAPASRAIRVQDAVPHASDRVAAVARACGNVPLLYWRPSSRRGARSGRTRVYIDVSGSMDAYVPLLYGALAALRNYVEPEVMLFSTTVVAIAMGDLRKGRVTTTGGTDITCVFDHVVKDAVARALVITDGYVGRPVPAQADAIQRSRAEIRVVLTPDGYRRDLGHLAARMDELPRLEDATAKAGGKS